MTAWPLSATAVAGGVGAVARYLLDAVITSRFHGRIPYGTLVINLTGSFLLGLVTGLAITQTAAIEVRMILGTGFLGGYTTFSTACSQTADLVRRRQPAAASVHAFGMLGGALLTAAFGLWLGGM